MSAVVVVGDDRQLPLPDCSVRTCVTSPPMALTIGSLFSGIGGLELGLERALGARTIWQVEIDAFARSVLERHWPHAERHADVRAVGSHNLCAVDIICGGFPCQDISTAGHGAGLDGERSSLFFDLIRIVRELGPRIVVLENVSALLDRGLGRVLGELAALGFDAEWSVLSACAVGAPHPRERLFIVAHTNGQHGPARLGHRAAEYGALQGLDVAAGQRFWVEPATQSHRVVDGVHRRVDGDAERLRALGNAVVPQVGEVVGRVIAQMLGGAA